MNALDETAVREQLHAAVDVLDPAGPPYDAIAARASKRKRANRLGFGVGAVALAAACAAIAVVVVQPGGKATVVQPATPTQQSLVDFAKANGAIHSQFGRIIAGPIESSAGFYGAFTVKPGVQVAKWNGTAWHLDGGPFSGLGQGRWVMKIGDGPLIDAPTPTIYVRGEGGDVSYFGSVLMHGATGWKAARFGACGHHRLCHPNDGPAYAHPRGAGMVSIQNRCNPCAAGHEYRIHWTWDVTQGEFVATKVRKLHN
jgi:hypothetical protein